MFDCTTIEERLSEYIDGLLPGEERSGVEAHLDGCAACRRLHGSMVEALGSARAFPSWSAPDDLVIRILAETAGLDIPTCPWVEARLSEYLDGLLASDERAGLEEHLGACRSCEELHDTMARAIGCAQAARSYSPPDWLVAQILANTPNPLDSLVRISEPSCARVTEQLSDLIDGQLSGDEEHAVIMHLAGCDSCSRIQESMAGLVGWGREFPTYEAPAGLLTRILEDTRPVPPEMRPEANPQWVLTVRETWFETLLGIGRWIVEPRTAMAMFTAVLVLGWMSNIAGVSLEPSALSNPSAVYYSVEELADDVYDRSVRFYYRVPHAVIGEIQFRIEQMRERS